MPKLRQSRTVLDDARIVQRKDPPIFRAGLRAILATITLISTVSTDMKKIPTDALGKIKSLLQIDFVRPQQPS